MSLETTALDHTLGIIRRQAEEDFKDLSLAFIVYADGDASKALDAKRHEIYEHPAGEDVFPALQKLVKQKPRESYFAGIATGEQKKLLKTFKTEKTLAVFFINAGDFKTAEDARESAYHFIWHALALIENYRKENTGNYNLSSSLVRPKHKPAGLAQENMLADIFSALMLQLTGQKMAIKALAKKRAQMVLQAIPGYKAEYYPYPIAMEAAKIVYDDLSESFGPKITLTKQATEMTQEIGQTFDQNAMRQWQVFALPAQEMAWLGYSNKEILSAATYTSEDAYVRSMAYLAAEILNLEPAPPAKMDMHNPFTEAEANERLHNKACERLFQNIITAIMTDENNAEPLLRNAQTQNKKLTSGHVVGWCAHTLMEAYEILKSSDPSKTEKAAAVFHESISQTTSWPALAKLSRLIMRKRREGKDITLAHIQALCAKHEDLENIRSAIEKAA